MKNLFAIIFLVGFISFSCEEKPDYLVEEGPYASYYPNTLAVVLEPTEEEVTITIQSTGVLFEASNAYVKMPADGSFVTSPAYDPFTKLLKVPITDDETSGVFKGEFTVVYKNNAIQQEKEIFEIEIVDVDGGLNGVANGVFQYKVVEDDFSAEAPFVENFNNSCSDNDGLPLGWEVVNRASDYTWRCSGSNRGASGDDGDYAIEMSNFGSPDGAGADDWLISPEIDLTNADGIMTFSSLLRYEGTTMEVLFSEDYLRGQDPTEATWVNLTAATNAFDSNTNSWDFVNSGNIDITGLPNKVYIAFRFVSIGAGSGETSTARVDNFEIR